VPKAPLEVTAAATGTTATVSWKSPRGSQPVRGYRVEMRTEDLSTWERKAVAEADVDHAEVSGLKKGKTYQFRVIAVNDAGESHPSAPVSVEVKA